MIRKLSNVTMLVIHISLIFYDLIISVQEVLKRNISNKIAGDT